MDEQAQWAFLSGGGTTAQLIAAYPWEQTSLGPIEQWPSYLRATVATVLRSDVPIVTLWHEAGWMIYNDAYSVFAAGRHPKLLGSAVREGWPEVADFNDNVMKVGLGGRTLSYQDQELTLHRTGTPEQVWMNLDYSPLLDPETGSPVGVMAIVVETTDKVRAERRVRGEQGRLEQMFRQAPGFMAMLSGPSHVFDFVNPAYLQLVGHRSIVGKTVREALPEVEGQGFFELLDRVYQTGETYAGHDLVVKLQRAPGAVPEQRTIDLVYQPLRGDDGEVVGIFVEGTDVTARVAAQRALRESEAQFRVFAQAVPAHVWAARSDGMLYWFNRAVYEFSGAGEGDLDGEKWTTIVHPDDLPSAAQRWAEALVAGRPYETEFRLRRKDGSWRWHLARALPVRGDGSEVITGWVGANIDVQEQKSGAQQLEMLNRTLEQQVAERTADRDRMWRLSTDVMLVAQLDGTVVSINPAWTTVLGWGPNELKGRSFLELVHPDDRAATLAEVGRLAQGRTTLRFENRYACKEGDYRILSWTAVPAEGMIHAVGRDVTADKEAAAALKRSEALLQQSQKMEAIGQLTGGVAHDFNNLLQVVGGNLQLLRNVLAGNDRAEKLISGAMSGVSRGARLASHLLAFARRQPLEPRVVNIGRFVAAMEEMLGRTLGDGVDVEIVISAGLWNTLVDPVQVENAVLNLAINARDAMDGAGRLTIEVGNAALSDDYASGVEDVTPGQYVMIAVTDTGIGMPADVVAKAFEPFFSTKPEGRGTGLGLSMVYGFVKQSGGHVKIYSEVGHGTTVKMYLPRSLKAEEIQPEASSKPAVGGTETILVAEDDDEVRGTVVAMLESLGYKVLKARDASSALAIVESGVHIDLLFTDVVMPGALRSPELARLAVKRQPDLAVLFTSGYTENAIVHGGRLDPGVELLGKPYTQEALARKVRHVLANRAHRSSITVTSSDFRSNSEQPAPEKRPLRLLVVEDDADIRSSTSELLQLMGYTVSAVGTAQAALRIIEEGPVDIMVVDIGLPDMPGDQLAHIACRANPALRVIFSSGAPVVDPPVRCVVLRKPYNVQALSEAVEELADSGNR